MHVMQAEVSYNHQENKALLKDTWEAARAQVRGLDLPEWEIVDPERVWEPNEYGKYWSAEGVVTADELQVLSDLGLKPRVSRMRGLFSEKNPQRVLEDARATGGHVQIDISVPGGVALMSLRSVDWLEDCCTQKLQEYLDLGWRLVAVCPPNDTRRPTYIIGHQDNPAPRK